MSPKGTGIPFCPLRQGTKREPQSLSQALRCLQKKIHPIQMGWILFVIVTRTLIMLFQHFHNDFSIPEQNARSLCMLLRLRCKRAICHNYANITAIIYFSRARFHYRVISNRIAVTLALNRIFSIIFLRYNINSLISCCFCPLYSFISVFTQNIDTKVLKSYSGHCINLLHSKCLSSSSIDK